MLVVSAGRRWVDPIGPRRRGSRLHDATRGTGPLSRARPPPSSARGRRHASRAPRARCSRRLRARRRVCRSRGARAPTARATARRQGRVGHAPPPPRLSAGAKVRAARGATSSVPQLHHDCSWFLVPRGVAGDEPLRDVLDETQLWLVDSGWDYLTTRVRTAAAGNLSGGGGAASTTNRGRRAFAAASPVLSAPRYCSPVLCMNVLAHQAR